MADEVRLLCHLDDAELVRISASLGIKPAHS